MVSQQIPPGGAIVQLDTHLLIKIFYTDEPNFQNLSHAVELLGSRSTFWFGKLLRHPRYYSIYTDKLYKKYWIQRFNIYVFICMRLLCCVPVAAPEFYWMGGGGHWIFKWRFYITFSDYTLLYVLEWSKGMLSDFQGFKLYILQHISLPTFFNVFEKLNGGGEPATPSSGSATGIVLPYHEKWHLDTLQHVQKKCNENVPRVIRW